MKQSLVVSGIISFLLSMVSDPILCAEPKPTPTYRVNLIQLPGFVNSATEGLGVRLNQEILSRIEQREDVSFEVTFYPAKRSFGVFNNGGADLIFPTVLGTTRDDPTAYQKPATIDSAAIVGSGYVIFTPSHMPKLSAISDLKGKSVGIVKGNTLPQQLNESQVSRIEVVELMETNFTKLLAGRIDAVLVLKALGLAEMNRLQIANLHHGREFQHVFGSYSAHLSPQGARLIEYVNQAIGEMIKDGTYQIMLEGYQQSILNCCTSNKIITQ